MDTKIKFTPEKISQNDYYAILHSMVGFAANVSDTFGYACADCEEIGCFDMYYLILLFSEFGFSDDAFVAYAAIRRGIDPLPQRMTNQYFKWLIILLSRCGGKNIHEGTVLYELNSDIHYDKRKLMAHIENFKSQEEYNQIKNEVEDAIKNCPTVLR
jgi:hypothetical protein